MTSDDLKAQANAEFQSGSFLKAAAAYTKAIKVDPQNAVLYRWASMRWQCHRKKGNGGSAWQHSACVRGMTHRAAAWNERLASAWDELLVHRHGAGCMACSMS
eukprot:365987-Chlamydomonas_euryale.AAC.7